jgi:hypothetical protein
MKLAAERFAGCCFDGTGLNVADAGPSVACRVVIAARRIDVAWSWQEVAASGRNRRFARHLMSGGQTSANQKLLRCRRFLDGRGGFRTCDLSRVKRALSH